MKSAVRRALKCSNDRPNRRPLSSNAEARAAELDARLSAPAPFRVRLHPTLSEVYRRKVAALAETLNDPAIRTSALETVRSLISSVTINEADGQVAIELEGAITAMIALAQPETGKDLEGSSVKVVAGAGFEPAAFRL